MKDLFQSVAVLLRPGRYKRATAWAPQALNPPNAAAPHQLNLRHNIMPRHQERACNDTWAATLDTLLLHGPLAHPSHLPYAPPCAHHGMTLPAGVVE